MTQGTKSTDTVPVRKEGVEPEQWVRLVAFLLKTWKGSTFLGAPSTPPKPLQIDFSDPFEGQSADSFDPFSDTSEKDFISRQNPSLCTTHDKLEIIYR